MDRLPDLDPITADCLRSAGWHRGRRVDVSVAIRSLESQGYVAGRTIVSFLESLWGLRLDPANEEGPNFINGEPFIVDPVGVGRRHRDEADEIYSAIGGSWFPIGWWLSYSHVFMDQSGALVAFADGLIWRIGDNLLDGLRFMVQADRPLMCIHAPEGRKPWPAATDFSAD
ncbi:hypothetical protein Pth03_34960 [Planotetraspora thailandica]|uniref:SUKH-3 domain containing protein n=1 Tax=Planotetraspora thailandica TaxID=487172 RepID=A0A8J3V3X9_9ACTN|nr:hypothetical protein Pth03_34960 [Planotetraspora thailandica]